MAKNFIVRNQKNILKAGIIEHYIRLASQPASGEIIVNSNPWAGF